MRSRPAGVQIDGSRVRELRKLAGDPVSALAAKAEVSPQYISAIETGRRPTVSPPVFARICDALGVADRAQLAREPLRPPRQRRRPAGEAEPVKVVA